MLYQHHDEPQQLPPSLLATLYDICMQFAQCHCISHSWWYYSPSDTTGQVPDISFLLLSSFGNLFITKWTKVDLTPIFHHIPMKNVAIWVGFAEDKGAKFTWRILADDTQKILIQSSVDSVICTSTNKRFTLLHGEGQKTDLTPKSFVYDATSSHEDFGLMPTINFISSWENLPSFWSREWEHKQTHIVEHVNHLEDSQVAQEDQLHLCIKIQNQDEEFISYNQLMDFLEQHSEPEELADGYFKFRGIKAHQGPLDPDHPH